MKFKIHAKLETRAKNLSFSVPLEHAMSTSTTWYVEKLQECVSECFSIKDFSICIKNSKGCKVVVRNDRQLVDYLLCSPCSSQIYISKNEYMKPKLKPKPRVRSSCMGKRQRKRKAKKKTEAAKQERKKVNDSDLSDYDCDRFCGHDSDYSQSIYSHSESDHEAVVDYGCDFRCDTRSECSLQYDERKKQSGEVVPAATLERGDTGDDVKLLQKHLEDLGFLDNDWYVSGRFGRSTAKAVEAFRYAYAVNGSSDKGKYDRVTAQVLKELVSNGLIY